MPLSFLQWIVFFLPLLLGFLCNLGRKSSQNVEKLPDFSAKKKRRILSRLWLSWFFRSRISGKKKARDININFFVRLVLRRSRVCPGDFTGFGFVPGTNPLRTWDKPGFSPYFTQWKPSFHRVCPWDKPSLSLGQSRGRRAAQKVYVKKVYVPSLLARIQAIQGLLRGYLKLSG